MLAIVELPVWVFVVILLSGEIVGVLSTVMTIWVLSRAGKITNTKPKPVDIIVPPELSSKPASLGRAAKKPTPEKITVDKMVLSKPSNNLIYPDGYDDSGNAVAPVKQYRYFVTGSDKPFDTLQDALIMFPVERDKDVFDWDKLPAYVQRNIRRVLK